MCFENLCKEHDYTGERFQELELSEKTIAHHLIHIFNETTSENRASAAAFAIRHGLVMQQLNKWQPNCWAMAGARGGRMRAASGSVVTQRHLASAMLPGPGGARLR
jgi:hypothetical protein